jgi:hypothetical protein
VRGRDYQPQRSYAGGDPVHVQFPPEHLFEVE